MKKFYANAAVVLALVLWALPAAAGSLWSDSSDSLFTDKKALYVGDIVTIVVIESTNATHKANTDVKQGESMNSGTGTGILGQFLEGFGIDSSDEYTSTGATTAGNTLQTTISAEVMEVLPNGNLVIEARRSMIVNEETQTMILSGTIRTNDVTRDNTVSSTRIANLGIRYQGKGPIARRQRIGLLNKLFDMIF
jgi:flagellar L-ring protein FlgH